MTHEFDIFDAPSAGQSLTGVSSSPEWGRLDSWTRRAISLHIERQIGLTEALRTAHAADPAFSETALKAAVQALLVNPDVQFVLKALSTRTRDIVRQS